MHTGKLLTPILAALAIMLTIPAQGAPEPDAADTGPVVAEPPAPTDPVLRQQYDKLQQFMRRKMSVAEGIGFQGAQIGQSFRTVQSKLGRPARREGRSLLGGERRWHYRLDAYTDLRLSGKDRVEAIAFRGTASSLYHTRTGAYFGMTIRQITLLYGVDGLVRTDEYLEYPRRGIRFQFESGVLRAFEVFAPRRA